MKRFLTLMSLLMVLFLNAQVGVGTTNPDFSAILDVTSSTKGFLPPRMTYVQRATITSPAIGLIVFCTNCGSTSVGGELQVFSGGIWRNMVGTAASFATPNVASTTAASAISFTTATSGGNVTSDGGSNILERGICWSSTQTQPTTANSTSTASAATGIFTCNLTGLTPNTKYFVCAYARNNLGTVYGPVIEFTTLPATTPTLASTTAASNIGAFTATSGGNVTSDGGSNILERGICWSSTQTLPTTANSKTADASATTGTFMCGLTGLTAFTKYYVRSYARNNLGTEYGPVIDFTTTNSQPIAGSLNFVAAGTNIPNGNVTWSTTSYLSMTPGLKFGAGAFTIEFWFNTTNFTNRGILGGDNSVPGFLNLHFDTDKSITVDKNGGGGSFAFSSATSITPNVWHYLVLNRNSNGALAMFIDGVKWTSSTNTSSLDFTAFTPHIGRDYAGGWSGNLTNFRVTIGTAVYDSNAGSLTNPTSELSTLINTKYLMLGSSVTGDASSTQTVTNNNNVSTSSSKPF